jgi:hypothetical protein
MLSIHLMIWLAGTSRTRNKSVLATFFVGYFNLWGMPFFFLMAGATSWFSLRRRNPGRYIHERVTRLLIPFIIGVIVLTPIQAYFELTHKGWWGGGSIVDFAVAYADQTESDHQALVEAIESGRVVAETEV